MRKSCGTPSLLWLMAQHPLAHCPCRQLMTQAADPEMRVMMELFSNPENQVRPGASTVPGCRQHGARMLLS